MAFKEPAEVIISYSKSYHQVITQCFEYHQVYLLEIFSILVKFLYYSPAHQGVYPNMEQRSRFEAE
jgi:hypothetical protein